MEAYLDDLRERVVAAYDKGVGSLRELAELFGVSRSWIGKLLEIRRSLIVMARSGCSAMSNAIG